MKRKWLISSICLMSVAIGCGDDSGGGGDETGGTGGTAVGGTGGTTGGTGGTTGGTGGTATGGTGGIHFGGNTSGGTGGTGGSTGGTGGSTGGTGGTGGSTGGTGGTGGAGNTGNPCTAAGWTAGANIYCGQNGNCPDPNGPFTANRAIDGNAGTRYTSGKKQDGTEEFTITFSGNVSLTGITLTAATAGDAPAMYEAQYSTNGTTYMPFTPAVTGAGAGSTVITFPATVMKAIKIKQTGMYAANVTAWWSINEITVQGCVAQ